MLARNTARIINITQGADDLLNCLGANTAAFIQDALNRCRSHTGQFGDLFYCCFRNGINPLLDVKVIN
jgi:hypothetical protein